jgi:hypothetical protein
MISSFTTRFRKFIWFLIFSFTLYSIPHLELLLPYKIHFSLPEAQASEPQATETQPQTTQPQAPTEASDNEPSSQPQEIPKEESASSMTTLSGGGASEMGGSSVSFKVDDFSGAAHLSYPLVVPPGRNGLNPNLSLNYLSAGGNGWLGVGWDLSVGFIQRRGVRKGVPKYDSTDLFEIQLGGGSPQELLPIGGDEYRLRIEGVYLKIKYDSSGNYWELWDKTGVRMRFGFTVESRIGKVRDPSVKNETFRWCLDRVEDPKTNYMELIYFRDQDANSTFHIYLQKIQYNGQVTGGLSHNHEIFFNLEPSDRPDPVYNFRGGFKSFIRKRLSSIEVKTSGSLVRKY